MSGVEVDEDRDAVRPHHHLVRREVAVQGDHVGRHVLQQPDRGPGDGTDLLGELREEVRDLLGSPVDGRRVVARAGVGRFTWVLSCRLARVVPAARQRSSPPATSRVSPSVQVTARAANERDFPTGCGVGTSVRSSDL